MTAAAQQALEMLDTFASVGAKRFDVIFADAAGAKVGFRGSRPFEYLLPAIPEILNRAAEQQHNVIVRPLAGATLI